MSYFWFGNFFLFFFFHQLQISLLDYESQYDNDNVDDDDNDNDEDYNSYDEDPSTCCGQCVRDENSPVKIWNSYQNMEIITKYGNHMRVSIRADYDGSICDHIFHCSLLMDTKLIESHKSTKERYLIVSSSTSLTARHPASTLN